MCVCDSTTVNKNKKNSLFWSSSVLIPPRTSTQPTQPSEVDTVIEKMHLDALCGCVEMCSSVCRRSLRGKLAA